ncbi:MAG: hydrogenase nickel incorporation protein HypB [Chitinispirillaceae bacterium]|nr:hydrogenase nickel incorporation protein HypB [Chitinispirillaceae bacterium]
MGETITIAKNVHAANDVIARRNRARFAKTATAVLNMISSPGSGKTAILERMARMLGPSLAVITGDVQTTLDADRITQAGGTALQIETGGSCHLNAAMVEKALASLDLAEKKLLVIENVGNLVCPSTYDLGEQCKVAVLSVTEGDEKPVKYPALFTRASAVIVNKIDLLPHVTFSIERVKTDCAKLNSEAAVFPLSAKTGEGFAAWLTWCESVVRG